MRRARLAAWWLLLALPAATVYLPTHTWDESPFVIFGTSLLSLAMLRILAGHRCFLLLSYPLAFFGLFAVAAHVSRNADVLELIMLGALGAEEVKQVLRPYAWILAGSALALGLMVATAWSASGNESARPRAVLQVAMVALCVGLSWWAPGAAARSWPANLVTVTIAHASGRHDLLGTMFPYAHVNPRNPEANWSASRPLEQRPARETFVLVIGESVRPDSLRACGGRTGWAEPSPDRLVFCDMMAGSSSTHTSVPLLVSRELPGEPLRVSRDASFLSAFAQSGFRTSWLSVQERTIAWPDAQDESFLPMRGTDQASLLPAVSEQLAKEYDKQMIVVHAYNAHFAYCDRYDHASRLLPVDCAQLGTFPTPLTRAAWLDAYDNAVHEATRFLDAVFTMAARRGGAVFLLYTSDHGENLIDDDRKLFQHALAEPTRWDTRVPLVVMANESWRQRHPERWQQLRRNTAQAVIHADVVPTLLGAAEIRYEERRSTVADLTRVAPAARSRLVVRRLGHAVDGDELR